MLASHMERREQAPWVRKTNTAMRIQHALACGHRTAREAVCIRRVTWHANGTVLV